MKTKYSKIQKDKQTDNYRGACKEKSLMAHALFDFYFLMFFG